LSRKLNLVAPNFEAEFGLVPQWRLATSETVLSRLDVAR